VIESTKRRLALITGGAQGVGRAIADRLAQNGVSLLIGDIQLDAARQAVSELAEAGAEATALRIDVSDEQSVAQAYAEIDRRFGRLDILVNNAGVLDLVEGKRSTLEDMPLATWERTVKVNLTGAFLMSRGAIPLMRRGKWGRIVNITSVAARKKTSISNSAYAASKAGMHGFSRVLAVEVGRDGITVNCVAPSRMVTAWTMKIQDQDYFERGIAETAIGRLTTPADVANTTAFLCSEDANFLTGTIIDVNGGAFMP